MKECDKQESHISSKLHVIYISSNNVRHPVTKTLTLRLLISHIYGAPSKARNANVVYIWTYVWQR